MVDGGSGPQGGFVPFFKKIKAVFLLFVFQIKGSHMNIGSRCIKSGLEMQKLRIIGNGPFKVFSAQIDIRKGCRASLGST